MNAATNAVEKTVPINKCLKLRLEQGYSYQAIADKFKLHKTSVFKALKPILDLIDNPELALAYQNNRANILNNLELTLASDLANAAKREKASLNNTAYAFTAISNARRLESNQSTSNIAFADIAHALTTAQAERQAIVEELARLELAADTDQQESTQDQVNSGDSSE